MCKDSNSKKRVELLEITKKYFINDEYYILVLKSDNLPKIKAGQFVQMKVAGADKTFLRRPISVYEFNENENTLSLLIKIVGEGTFLPSLLKEGDKLDLIYPLGNGFTHRDNNKSALLIGGGVGVAPLLMLAKELKIKGIKTTIALGGRSKQHIIEAEKFSEYGDVLITTDDGSLGEKALITQHSKIDETINNADAIYTCGPEPMMKAVAELAKEKNTFCEASLENLMACGIGACLCCVQNTTEGHKVVCTQGPVLDASKIKW